MIIKKIDFSDVANGSNADYTESKQIIKIDDNSMVVIIKWNAKIFDNDELEALRNIFLVDKEGNVIWRVSSKDDDAPFVGHFISINYKDNILTAFRWGGFKCNIDIKTGIVTDTTFVK
jgi:hypothetical protein